MKVNNPVSPDRIIFNKLILLFKNVKEVSWETLYSNGSNFILPKVKTIYQADWGPEYWLCDDIDGSKCCLFDGKIIPIY